MEHSTQRATLRTLHLIGAGLIGTYVYSPWHDVAWFALLNQVLVVPALALSGVWLWRGQRLGQWWRGKGHSARG